MSRRAPGALLLVALAVFPLVVSDEYYIHLLVMAALYYVLAAGMNLLLAGGQLTLGHTAFFGIGAYTSGLLTLHYAISPLLGMVAAGAVAGALGYLLGRITLQLRGAYFVLVTIGFAEVIRLVDTNWIDLTQGPLGLPGVPAFDLGAASLTLTSKRHYYYLGLVLALGTFLVTARLLRSRFGRALSAIRQNENLAQSSGISAYRYTLLAMVVACTLAGVAGSFYAHYINFLSPELFSFANTVTMVVTVVAGGQGTVAGPAVGALVFTLVPEVLRMASFYRMLAYGFILLLVVMFMPRGIVYHVRGILGGAPARRRAPGTRERVTTDAVCPAAALTASTLAAAPAGLAAPARVDAGQGAPVEDGTALEVTGVTVRFGGLAALHDFSMVLRSGEILALIGPNGAGKTTAFNVVTGFQTPTAGTVRHRGVDITALAPHEICGLGLVRMFQKTSVFPESSVRGNVITACHRLGHASFAAIVAATSATRREEAALAARADALLDFTGLAERAEELARNLSYGEQRMLGLAIALAPDPVVLMLDEPAAGLNAVETTRVMALVERIRARGISVLLVEHDMKMVMGMSDRIVVLNHGQKIVEGAPAEIQRHPEVIRAYLGSGDLVARP
jgi:ABC-type branched-subunit amino acid transport system ATPase component/ABC-type branched-subunit amino acid transport system permease subunit